MSHTELLSIAKGDDKEDNDNYEYFDTDQDELYVIKKNQLNKIRKLNNENEQIESRAKELNVNIDGLDGKIHAILSKHHSDYITTFNEFMDTVRKDLKEKIEKMEKVEREKRKNENHHLIIAERDFFRQEAIRLNQLCKELSMKVDEMTRELKFQSMELGNISRKWKDSENTNKQLIVELERNIQMNRELEAHIKFNQENRKEMSEKIELSPVDDGNDYYSHYNNIDDNKDKLLRIVEKLKIELKRERGRNHKIVGEFNKIMMDKNKLEKIFLDCVEESRKDILHRRLKDNLNNRTMSSFKNKANGVMPIVNDVKYDNFLPTDKKRLIEYFLLKEEVVNLIKDNIFKRSDTNISEMGQTKSSFMKTDKLFRMSNMKKTISSGFHSSFHINPVKTTHINY